MSHALSDTATMVRRTVRHTVRYPVTIVASLVVPVLILLLFVGVFGDALAGSVGGGSYVNYLLPGVLLMTMGYGWSSTALAVNRDMTEGIIARFRTMAIFRPAILIGHVVGAMARTLIGIGLVIGVALAVGFRPAADFVGWLAAIAMMALVVLAFTWLAVAIGLASRTPEGTSGLTIVVQVLPFLSSAFLQPDAMTPVVRAFAAHEPFTPIIDTVRGLLLGTPVGDSALIAVAWCVGIALVGYLWARRAFAAAASRSS